MTKTEKDQNGSRTASAVREPVERKKRIPFGAPKRHWRAPENDGYVYRVFNDGWVREQGRVKRALEAGYEVVDDPKSGRAVGTNGDGSPINGVLMRIAKELYQEDQKLKQTVIDEVDREIHAGRFQEKAEDKRYIPKSGIEIESKLTP